MEDETEHKNQSVDDPYEAQGTNASAANQDQRSADNSANSYETQTTGVVASVSSDAALDRIMPPTRPLSPEPTLDPDAIHFAKGHPDTLVDHIKDWIEWRLNKI